MPDPKAKPATPDPWADDPSLAHQGSAAPTQSGKDDDWKIWQQEQPQEQQGNFLQRAFDQAVEPRLHSADQGVMSNIGTGLLNVGKGVLSLGAPLAHPLETAKAGIDLMQSPYGEAAHNLVRPFVEHPIEAAEEFAGQALGGKGLGMAAKGASVLADPLRAYRSPLIPENEAIARAATDVIKPNPLEYRKTVGNLMARMPEAKEYLQRSGITKPSSPLEFGKGATGAGEEASRFFQDNLITPNSDAPAGSGTVGSVYGRVSEINNKLRPMYRAQTMGEQLSKEAADHMQALEAERDKLNGVMYKAISDRSGLPIEEVRDINQRGAQLQGVGDVADASQAVRRMGMTYSPGGMRVPMGGLERAMRAVDYFRGGPEAVAGRKLGRIMGKVTEPAKMLPNPEEIENNRANYQAQEQDAANSNRMASELRKPEGIGATESPFLQPVMMNPAPELEARQGRMAARGEVQESRLKAQRAAEVAQRQEVLRKNQLLAKGREIQRQARVIPEYRNKEQ